MCSAKVRSTSKMRSPAKMCPAPAAAGERDVTEGNRCDSD